MRPHQLGESAVAGVAPVLGDAVDQLAMAVVLRHRVAAAGIDAARHLAVLELIRRIPVDVVAHRITAAHAQQALGNHRAIADPAARIRTRARLQAWADARDQHVRDRGAQGIHQRLARSRHLQRDHAQLLAPLLGHLRLRLGHVQRLRCPATGLWQHHRHFTALAGLQLDRVHQRTRRHAGAVLHRCGRRVCAAFQMHRIKLAVERTGKARVRHLQRVDARLTVDPHQLLIHIQCIDAAETTDGVEELGGRVDLPRADRQRQGVLVRDLVRIAQTVAADQLRALRRTLHEAGHCQADLLMHPVDVGDRQVVILQRLGDGHLRPVQQLAIEADERLDAEAALGRLQCAILADQCLFLATIKAEQGPVRLLAHIGTRQRAPWQVGGDRGQECVRGGSKGQRLERDVADAVAPVRAVLQIEAHVARIGVRQRQPVAATGTTGDFAHGAPVAAILGGAHGVAAGFQVRQPVDHRTTDLAALVQVQADGLLLDATADPERIALAVDHAVLQRGGGIGDHRRHQRRVILGWQALQGQLVEAHCAAAADLAVDRELDRGAACHLLFGRRPPRLVDLATAILDRRPRLGETVAGTIDPPDVVAAGIDQLELQVVAR